MAVGRGLPVYSEGLRLLTDGLRLGPDGQAARDKREEPLGYECSFRFSLL